ncbi:MAG: hypothetical protein WCX81_02635, partial [Monoglobales bacterium]
MVRQYDFKDSLQKVHRENIRNYDIKPNSDDFVLSEEIVITVPKNVGEVVKTAAGDFIDYLFTSMNISAIIGIEGIIEISVAAENPSKETAFDITFDEKIYISAADERSVAQALYYLEDLMSERKAPYIKKEKISIQMPFTLRMVPSTYKGILPPDEYLSLIAHQGLNTVMYGAKGLDNISATQFVALVKKLSKWGLDIYCCSSIPSKYHPDDPEAKDYYAKTYGEFIKRFPEVQGIILVGECIGFPSKDPNCSGVHRLKPADGIPIGKTDPGFYPCNDYYKFVNIVKDSVRPYNKDIDIVFWTYNFWSHPLEARMECINNLPTDISLMVTFELSEQYKMDGITKFCCDYTISRIGPCEV